MTEFAGVVPMISYADGPKAMDWLAQAFGFKERARMVTAEGRLSHGEMDTGHGMIMLATPSRRYEGPKQHREHCDTARAWSEVPYVIDGVLVYVDDVEQHCERARAAGATILTAVEAATEGRRYRAEDLEGHRWMFIER